ncbi:hypothetical protein HCU01_30700 [Halomonas cupida]|uniref:L,D-transpeptidase catalytic domain n=1 Tax=Halomonas cupida TaxID=44933 RepID=A0A1M7CBV5_9GAMM|nr:hypothetical protein HCU01_30700 [Halomonas cupida]SHL64745.1 L,D-transpeptidase catalytic domain [Halomonas cupida]
MAALAAPASAQNFMQQALTPQPDTWPPLAQTLSRLAPRANPGVLTLAARAIHCADPGAERLAVIDYSLPSTQPRMWVFDLRQQQLLFRELVSHGAGSGDAVASTFSNIPESHQSSIGLFRTLNSYDGSNGYSLRLQGLEPGVNDNAFDRAIVIHGADYVSEEFIEKTGRIGRSHGCPAVRSEVAIPLINSIKDNQYLFTYYPDQNWLRSSAFLRCPTSAHQLAMQN